MSKSDKDLESRTVANSPLQQSSFVFFPEEENIRKKLLQDPAMTLQAAKGALEDQKKRVEAWSLFLRSCFETGIKTIEELSLYAENFAQKLPQSVFGVGDGSGFLLPMDSFFERVHLAELKLNRLILQLDPFWQPDVFDPSRFAFLETVLPQAKLATEAEKVGAEGNEIRSVARTLSEQIDSLLSGALQPFVGKAALAADLDNNAANMRFGKLAALCGELQSAVERLIKEWGKTAKTIWQT